MTWSMGDSSELASMAVVAVEQGAGTCATMAHVPALPQPVDAPLSLYPVTKP